MSTTIKPTPGRIVWYRGADGFIRAAIVAAVNGDFNLNLYVFGQHAQDPECGPKDSVTHADPEQEPGCFPSWHWMPYQKQQAEKHAQPAPGAAHAGYSTMQPHQQRVVDEKSELDVMHRVVSGRRIEVLAAGGPLLKHFYKGDTATAMRRAIVLCAADIGHRLP